LITIFKISSKLGGYKATSKATRWGPSVFLKNDAIGGRLLVFLKIDVIGMFENEALGTPIGQIGLE